ncbi:hypothetical protein AURDEDRAFT_186229 [Auricularia subglabra TFB-10046 SS5]|nr:hypothetical protein AURDEDRAFT_186229 [Auricularia subglabra TFB-10046 SS5]
MCHSVPLAKKAGSGPSRGLALNQDILAYEMDLLVLARLQVLDAFMELASNAGLSEEDARIKWFWLQIRPIELAGLDVFTVPLNEVRSLDRAEVARRVQRLALLHKDRVQFVALDEAQILCRVHEMSFASADFRRHRPMLRQMLVCLASSLPHSRLIVCGTEVDPALFDDAIESSLSVKRTWRKFSSLGQFTGRDEIRNYLAHFFGDSLSPDKVELAYNYFRGRRRFLAVLVHRTLVHGIAQYTNVLDSILFLTTGLRRPGCSGGHIDVRLGPVTRDGILEGSKMATQMRWAAYANVTQHRAPVFRENARRLVGLAVAHFVDDDMDEALIDEPVILLNLARWLRSSARYATGALIEHRMQDPAGDLRGCGFAHSMALFLWRRFASGLRLTDIVSFHGSAPRWAAQAAPFALTSMDSDSRNVEPIKRLDGPLIQGADHPDDVLAWFERSKCPFLIPDGEFGPQLIFILDALDGPRLVFVHLEPFDTARPHRHNQVTPRDPMRYYASDRTARKQLQRVLTTFPGQTADSKSARGAVYNALQIYAFAEVKQPRDSRRPPAATLRLHVVLNRPEPESSAESSDDASVEDASSEDDAHAWKPPAAPLPARLTANEIEYRETWLELRAADIGTPIR